MKVMPLNKILSLSMVAMMMASQTFAQESVLLSGSNVKAPMGMSVEDAVNREIGVQAVVDRQNDIRQFNAQEHQTLTALTKQATEDLQSIDELVAFVKATQTASDSTSGTSADTAEVILKASSSKWAGVPASSPMISGAIPVMATIIAVISGDSSVSKKLSTAGLPDASSGLRSLRENLMRSTHVTAEDISKGLGVGQINSIYKLAKYDLSTLSKANQQILVLVS